MFHFNFTLIDMIPTYIQEYKMGWINKDTVKSYISLGIIKQSDYARIVGEPYEETSEA